jgi:hypothetical protein
MLSTILQVIAALPKLWTLVKEIITYFSIKKEKQKKIGLENGIAMTKNAQTKEEMHKANEETTRNLP